MSDEKNILPAELEEVSGQDKSNTGVQDTSTISSSASEPEQRESLDSIQTQESKPVEQPQTESAEMFAKRQREAWIRNIAEGKKSLDDLESKPNLGWLVDDVKKGLGIQQQVAPKTDVASEIEKYHLKQEFEDNKKKLEGLPVDLHNKIVRSAKERVEDGADPMKALARELSKAQAEIDTVNAKKQTNRGSMQMPTGQPATSQVSYTQDELSKLGQADYDRVMDLHEKGEVTIT